MFHQNGVLSDDEYVSPVALPFGRGVWGLPDQFEKLHSSPKMRLTWAQHKNDLINQFTDELANRLAIRTDSEEWHAQSFKSFLAHYNYVVIENTPVIEEIKKPEQWLSELVDAVARYPEGLKNRYLSCKRPIGKQGRKSPRLFSLNSWNY